MNIYTRLGRGPSSPRLFLGRFAIAASLFVAPFVFAQTPGLGWPNGGIKVTNYPQFAWTWSGPAVLNFEIVLATDPGFNNIVWDSQPDGSLRSARYIAPYFAYDYAQCDFNTRYYYKIIGIDVAHRKLYPSATGTFATRAKWPYWIPMTDHAVTNTVVGPANTTGIPRQPTFWWTGISSFDDAYYRLQISNNSSFTSLAYNQVLPPQAYQSFALNALLSSLHTYYWRIRGEGDGTDDVSEYSLYYNRWFHRTSMWSNGPTFTVR